MNKRAWKTLLVVITDPFASEQPALTKAVVLAHRSGARLVLFNSFMVPQPVNNVPLGARSHIIEAAIRQRRERMQALLNRSGLTGAKCIVEWDYPAHEAIVRQALESKADMVITASHRHGRLARLLLANTDWELIRMCPCPVWFVRTHEAFDEPQILVAVDPFHAHDKPARLDDRLLHAAQVIRGQFDGHIGVIHACDVPIDAAPVRSLVLAKAQQAVEDLAAKHRIGAERCYVRAGQPDNIIASMERREGADLLVMGAVSRSIQTRPVIGNTAERVIDQVDCDVLVVKPVKFKVPAQVHVQRLPVHPPPKSRTTRRRTAEQRL
jgi:universal stress protein E